MFTTLFAQIGLLIAALICGSALLFGGRVERVVGLVIFVAWFATGAVQDRKFSSPINPNIAVIDVALLAFMLSVSLKNGHHWLLFATAFQLLTTLADFVLAVDRGLGARTYVATSYIWSYLTLVAMGAGTWARWHRRIKE